MKGKSNLIKTGFLLVLLSFLLHGLHYIIFKDLEHIMVYLLGDIAFIPLEVLFVTLVIDKLLERREKEDRLKKLNMLIGLFYQEIGMSLLKTFAQSDPSYGTLKNVCKIQGTWESKDFRTLEKTVAEIPRKVEISNIDLDSLSEHMKEHKQLIINLIANPSLLEHETFSELLLAVSHLQEELALRGKVKEAHPNYDNTEHLKIDVERAYGCILTQWITYVEHLKTDYPFLFATALLTNPYDVQEIHLIKR